MPNSKYNNLIYMITKIFYTLLQLSETHTDLRYRNVKYRLNKLLSVNEIEIGEYLYKQNNKWFVHYSLIDKFQPIRQHKSHKSIKYKNEITINLKINYDAELYHHIGNLLIKELRPFDTVYYIEKNKYFHIHLATNADDTSICSSLTKIGKTMLIDILAKKYTHKSKIENKGQYFSYIRKANLGHGFSGMDSFADFNLTSDK